MRAGAAWRAGLLVLSLGLAPNAIAAERIDFGTQVRPILADRCYSCHGPDEGQRQAGFRVDREADAFAPLSSSERAIVRGDADSSVLLERVGTSDTARRMPPAYMGHDPLSSDEVAVLRRWIEEGAVWEGHWAFRHPTRPSLPATNGVYPPLHAVDAFVRERLTAEGLEPAPAADRRSLARRAGLDLTGLPPDPAAVEAFAADPSPDAFESFLESLLASPTYGEHQAARWLDAARYADTNGYQTDGVRSMWRWRDWVIDAFNRNMPFDQFTVEQLAGDMLPEATRSQIIATGFNRNHRTTAEGGSVNEEFRVEYVADRAETTATVWLGLTLACARCHDHKFDPLSQKEYYQFFAYFNNVQEKGMVWNFGNEDPKVLAPTPDQEAELDRLRAEADEADRAWQRLAQRVDGAQEEWERAVSATPNREWHPQRGLVAHIDFDSGLQTKWFTGGSIDGDVDTTAVPPATTEGLQGVAGDFDGTRYADLGEIGNFNYLDPVSVSAWVRPHTDANGAIVASMGENPIGSGWGLFVRGGKLWWHMSQRWTDLSVRLETLEPLAVGTWQHVLLTYDGNRKAAGIRMYINGEEQETNVIFDNLDWPSKSNATLKIGGGGGVNHRFDGEIDEVRLYGRALEPSEARSLSVREELTALASLPREERTAAQREKLREAFLDSGSNAAVDRALRAKREAHRRLEAYRATVPTVMVMREGPTRQAYVLDRGRYDAHSNPVGPGLPEALTGASTEPEFGDRLALARWISSRDNPLTARVMVNRVWQSLFGVGLVKTVDDFGVQGETPSHPELLDWLAVEFMDSGWDVKRLYRTIMTSATYRQSSRTNPTALERDPENRLLARGPRFRIPAATIRDQALQAGGLLANAIGGPSVKPYQPPGLWEEVSGTAYVPDGGEARFRRSLYTYWKRTVAPPSMINFDASDRETCTVRVKRTNTPLQALNLMNDPSYMDAARHLARTVLASAGPTASARFKDTYQRVLARPPSDHEAGLLADLLASYREQFAGDRDAAEAYAGEGAETWRSDAEMAELAAYTGLASLVLNLDEAVTKQ